LTSGHDAWWESAENVQLGWLKSSRSGSQASDCVEVAMLGRGVVTRDSKDPEGPVLYLTRDAWTALLDRVRSGALDL
jgi:hypothetical protein